MNLKHYFLSIFFLVLICNFFVQNIHCNCNKYNVFKYCENDIDKSRKDCKEKNEIKPRNVNLCNHNNINHIIKEKNKMDKLSKEDIKKELEMMMFEKELISISIYFCNSTDEAVDMIARMMEDDEYKLEMKKLFDSGNNKIKGGFIDDLLKNKTLYKMVIVVRKDINMSSGKMAAQVAHAAVNCYKYGLNKTPESVYNWEHAGATKIVLMVNSLKEFNALENKAKQLNINYAIIQDAGKTELEPGTVTTIAIGPAPVSDIDKITGDLSTYKD